MANETFLDAAGATKYRKSAGAGTSGDPAIAENDINDISKGTQTNDVKVTLDSEAVVLGAGTAGIGKLTANSGVDIGDVDVLSSALPSNAAQESSGNLDTIAGAVSGTEMQVDVVAALPAGTNAIGKLAANSGIDIGDTDVTSVVPGTAATNLGKAEDAAHTTGDVGVMALGVQQTADAALAGDGDYAPIQVDDNGYVKVNIKAGAGSGGTASTDDAAFTAGSGSGTPAMGFFSTDTVDANDVGVLAMDASRRLLCSIEVDNVGIGGGAGSSVDSNNSTTTPLTGGATFTGTGTDLTGSNIAAVCVTLYADVDSATDGMTFEFSTDNTNWDDSYAFTMDISSSDTRRFQFPVCARYFRVKYTNGAGAQSAFRVQTILHGSNQLTSIHRLVNDMSPDRSAQVVKSVLFAQAAGSGDFVPVDSTAGGNLKVAIEEFDASLPAGTNNIGDVDVEFNGTAASTGNGATDGGTQRVTISSDTTGVLSVDDNGGSLTVDNGGTFSVQVDGEALTSLQIMDDWDESDRAKVNLIAGQAGIAGGTGVDGATVPRFTLATDVALPAGTNNIGDVDIASAIPAGANTIGNVGYAPQTSGGYTIERLLSAATTNATSVKASAGQVFGWYLSNVNAAAMFLKLYNKASAPTVGTDTPVMTIPIPGNTAGAGANVEFMGGIAFGTGIAFAITGAVADADTTAVAANEIVVNLLYK